MFEITELKNIDNNTILKKGTKWTDGFDTFTIQFLKFDGQDYIVNCFEDQSFTWRFAKDFGNTYLPIK